MRTLLVCLLISVGTVTLIGLSQFGCDAPIALDAAEPDAAEPPVDLATAPDLALPLVGAACKENRECGRGWTCGRSWPNGYCTVVGCRYDTCPPDSRCMRLTSDTGYCLATCENDDQCRLHYRCERGVCMPRCDGPGLPLCLSGFVCNQDGHCVPE